MNRHPSETHISRRRFLSSTAGTTLSLLTAQSATARAAQQPAKTDSIEALLPRDDEGHHFVLYSDCCSGIPDSPYGANLNRVNGVVSRIHPAPEFIAFPGDAISGYTFDYKELRRQWNYWHNSEMKWAIEKKIPIYQSTSNHNTYDFGSEEVFRAVHNKLPQNGKDDLKGLAYAVRRDNLLYVSTHQFDRLSKRGARPYDESRLRFDATWLDETLSTHADAEYKFVAGHYPVYPVNGYAQYPLWCFRPEERGPFWDVLVKHKVTAYLASHVIAFDVQIHHGIPQIVSGGAGTAYGPGGHMPGRTEYFHAAQLAVDKKGLRYRVLDPAGTIREQLAWPFLLPPLAQWRPLTAAKASVALGALKPQTEIVAWRFQGKAATLPRGGGDQTLLCARDSREGAAPVWIGIDGDSGRLFVQLVPESGFGIQIWKGPLLEQSESFDFQICLHAGMGPGGVLFRRGERGDWSTLVSRSAKGAENINWPRDWLIGRSQSGPEDRPFRGENLRVSLARRDIPKV